MANATPIITICDKNDRGINSPWGVGTLDVNNGSAVPQSETKEIHIWNNKGGIESAADLVSSYITTKNINGDNLNEQLVTDKWVQANYKNESISTLNGFHAIGGDDILEICSDSATGIDKENHVISGTANSGSATDTSNFATVRLKVVPKINALKGLHQFKVRISGYYT